MGQLDAREGPPPPPSVAAGSDASCMKVGRAGASDGPAGMVGQSFTDPKAGGCTARQPPSSAVKGPGSRGRLIGPLASWLVRASGGPRRAVMAVDGLAAALTVLSVLAYWLLYEDRWGAAMLPA